MPYPRRNTDIPGEYLRFKIQEILEFECLADKTKDVDAVLNFAADICNMLNEGYNRECHVSTMGKRHKITEVAYLIRSRCINPVWKKTY